MSARTTDKSHRTLVAEGSVTSKAVTVTEHFTTGDEEQADCPMRLETL